MTLIFGIASAWVHEPGAVLLHGGAPDPAAIAARRANVVRAVERLIAPSATAAQN